VLPALAAFWFAALLGSGALLFASEEISLGALIVSALAAAGIGGATGWITARRIIHARAETRTADCTVQPFSVRDELVGLSHCGPAHQDIDLADLVSRLRASMERRSAREGSPARFGAQLSSKEVSSALKIALARLREVRRSA
jgi:hypothetical protein